MVGIAWRLAEDSGWQVTKSPDDWMPFNIIISYALVEILKTVSLSLFTQKLTIVHSKLRENASGLNSIVFANWETPTLYFQYFISQHGHDFTKQRKNWFGFPNRWVSIYPQKYPSWYFVILHLSIWKSMCLSLYVFKKEWNL